jgi:hypothetical protein
MEDLHNSDAKHVILVELTEVVHIKNLTFKRFFERKENDANNDGKN